MRAHRETHGEPDMARPPARRGAAARKTAKAPLVGVVMGSQTDWETMRHAAETLDRLGIPNDVGIHSAHRTPARLADWVRKGEAGGVQVFIAGAGMAAALPGVIATLTTRPVFGVPMETRVMGGLDSLLSICQMPAGIPVGATAIGRAGAVNAALLAAAVLGLSDAKIAKKLDRFRADLVTATPTTPS